MTGTRVKPDLVRDGIYSVLREEDPVLRALVAGAYPVVPPQEWFADPKLAGPTPIHVGEDGHIYGHIATFDVAHIGIPGKVRVPRSKSDYAYFKTGVLRTAAGEDVPVGQLTLAGGHASLYADAGKAVQHYDDTASAVADVNVGEDKWGVWISGAMRPDTTPEQLRALRASAPSGDWRPINGNLELVAICQVNVPGFPVTRARVASGMVTALVAAGTDSLIHLRESMLADAAVLDRLAAIEQVVFDGAPPLLKQEADAPIEAEVDPAAKVVTEAEAVVEAEAEAEAQAEGQSRIEATRAYIREQKRERLRARVRAGRKAAD